MAQLMLYHAAPSRPALKRATEKDAELQREQENS
jgi:hypothetical protein